MKSTHRSTYLPVVVILFMLASCRSPAPPGSSQAAPTKKWEVPIDQLHQVWRGNYHDDQCPAIGADGTIYVPGSRGLYALRVDGSQKWFHEALYQSPHFPLHFVLVDDNGNIWFDQSVEINGLRGGVTEVDADGHELPGAISMNQVSQIAEAYDGTVFVGMGGGAYPTGLNASEARVASGAKKYGFPGATFAFSQDGTVYAESSSGLVVTSLSDSHPVWEQQIPTAGFPALGEDGTIYAGGNGRLSAINRDGTGKWSFALPGHFLLSPSIADNGTVYIGSDDSNIYALTPEGRLQWKFTTGGAVRSTPAIAKNGTVYFGSADGKLYAIGADGKLKWAFTTNGQVFSPTIGSDGTIYVQNAEGKLFAIEDTEPNGGLSGQWPKFGGGLRNTARGVR